MLRLAPTMVLVFAFCGVACKGAPPAAMRLGTNVWPGYEPLFLARALGHLPEDEVKLIEYHSSSEIIRSFRNGTVEAAALTLDELLRLQGTGSDAAAFLVCDISHGADAIVARPPLSAMSELAGRRVAVEGGALGSFVFSRAIQITGMEDAPPTAVGLEVSRHEAAWTEGQIDAAVTFEPVLSRLVAQGGKVVFTSRDMPGEIVDVLVVSRAYAEAHPDRITVVEDAWFAALDVIAEDPNRALALMAPREQLTVEQLRKSYEGLRLPGRDENAAYLRGDSPRLVQVSRSLAMSMGEALSAEDAEGLILQPPAGARR